jgi:hypothetical protein
MAEGVLDLVWLFGETNRTMLKGASASKASGGASFFCAERSQCRAPGRDVLPCLERIQRQRFFIGQGY